MYLILRYAIIRGNLDMVIFCRTTHSNIFTSNGIATFCLKTALCFGRMNIAEYFLKNHIGF